MKLNALRNHKQNLGFQFWLTNLHIQTKVIHIIKSIFRQKFCIAISIYLQINEKRNMNSNIEHLDLKYNQVVYWYSIMLNKQNTDFVWTSNFNDFQNFFPILVLFYQFWLSINFVVRDK